MAPKTIVDKDEQEDIVQGGEYLGSARQHCEYSKRANLPTSDPTIVQSSAFNGAWLTRLAVKRNMTAVYAITGHSTPVASNLGTLESWA